MYPEGGIPNAVHVKLKDGRTYEVRVDAPSGHALNPMTDAEVEGKFHSMADALLTEQGASGALDVMWSLESLTDLDELFTSVVV